MTNTSCHCGQPSRGDVPTTDQAPAHHCRQCSPEHCELARYLRARQSSQDRKSLVVSTPPKPARVTA